MAVRATELERRHGQHSAVFHCSFVERTVTLIIYFIFILCVICIYLVLGADIYFFQRLVSTVSYRDCFHPSKN